MIPNTKSLIEKIKALPPERIDEVEDFVDFIAARELRLGIVPMCMAHRTMVRF